jgi:uncharacterized protein involved in exopolysaccharide biosynthesis
MPEARLPSSPQGWLVALLAGIVGFMAGFVTIAILGRMLG